MNNTKVRNETTLFRDVQYLGDNKQLNIYIGSEYTPFNASIQSCSGLNLVSQSSKLLLNEDHGIAKEIQDHLANNPVETNNLIS